MAKQTPKAHSRPKPQKHTSKSKQQYWQGRQQQGVQKQVMQQVAPQQTSAPQGPRPRHSELLGATVKLDRAKKHLNELIAVIQAFHATSPYELFMEEEPSTGDLLYKVKVKRQVPIECAVIVGDVIHNLRTALDFVAWQLVLANGGTPTKDTAFPIAKDATTFASMLVKTLKGASPRAICFIRQLRPYQGGNELLWKLHSLDIVDKHHLILTVGAAHQSVTLNFRTKIPGYEEIIESPEIALRPADKMFPLPDNAVLFRIARAARERASEVTLAPPSFTFEVYFGAAEFPSGEPVSATLEKQIKYVRQIIDLVDRFIL